MYGSNRPKLAELLMSDGLVELAMTAYSGVPQGKLEVERHVGLLLLQERDKT